MQQQEAPVEPPAGDDGTPMETIEVKSYVGALCTPSLCTTMDIKPAGVSAMKQRATGSSELKCNRCGACGHAHEVCMSTKPIWGRDWREYRERRRHRRSTRSSAKKRGKSVAGAKISTIVGGRIKEVEDSKKHKPVQRKMRQVERLKMVARVGDALDMEPATRSTVPGT